MVYLIRRKIVTIYRDMLTAWWCEYLKGSDMTKGTALIAPLLRREILMKATKRLVCVATVATMLFTGNAFAVTLQDLSSAANSLASSNTATAGQSASGLSSLTSLLAGGSNTLSSSTISNATGILGYCAKQKLVSATSATNIKDQLMTKLGLGSTTTTATATQDQQTDYQQGLQGLLDAANGQQINLSTLGNTDMGKKVKEKACDLVLKQGTKFLS